MLSLMVASIIASLVLLVPLSDVYGRKPVNLTLGSLLVLTVGLIVASTRFEQLQRLELLAFLICTSIGLSAARAVIAIVYASELSMKDYTFLIVIACFIYIAYLGIITAVQVHLVNDSSLLISHICVIIVVNAITLPLQAWLLPESPAYLLASGEKSDFYDALSKLQRFNNLCRRVEKPVEAQELAKYEPDSTIDDGVVQDED